MLAVTGVMGCGKSSALAGLAGEMFLWNGEVLVGGTPQNELDSTPAAADATSRPRIGYCGQRPWLTKGSIRDNILLGRSYESERCARPEAHPQAHKAPNLSKRP